MVLLLWGFESASERHGADGIDRCQGMNGNILLFHTIISKQIAH
jgi:hypothetical protein